MPVAVGSQKNNITCPTLKPKQKGTADGDVLLGEPLIKYVTVISHVIKPLNFCMSHVCYCSPTFSVLNSEQPNKSPLQ